MDKVVVIIPVLNEADNILTVLESVRASGFNKVIVGVDVSSHDGTEVLLEESRVHYTIGKQTGYDGTVFAAINAIEVFFPETEYILFCDAGGKYPYAVAKQFLVAMENGADLVLGVRTEMRQHMLWHQKVGTQIVLFPLRIFFGQRIVDISPFRMIRRTLLNRLQMKPKRFRFPSEMLIKALAVKACIVQVPVISLSRQGTSKVSGSLRNSLRAGKDMVSSLQFLWYRQDKEK